MLLQHFHLCFRAISAPEECSSKYDILWFWKVDLVRWMKQIILLLSLEIRNRFHNKIWAWAKFGLVPEVLVTCLVS